MQRADSTIVAPVAFTSLLCALIVSFLLARVFGSKNGFPDAPSETFVRSELLARLLEIFRHGPADRGVSLRFGCLLLMLLVLLRVLIRKTRVLFFTKGLLFHELWLEGCVHWMRLSVIVSR